MNGGEPMTYGDYTRKAVPNDSDSQVHNSTELTKSKQPKSENMEKTNEIVKPIFGNHNISVSSADHDLYVANQINIEKIEKALGVLVNLPESPENNEKILKLEKMLETLEKAQIKIQQNGVNLDIQLQGKKKDEQTIELKRVEIKQEKSNKEKLLKEAEGFVKVKEKELVKAEKFHKIEGKESGKAEKSHEREEKETHIAEKSNEIEKKESVKKAKFEEIKESKAAESIDFREKLRNNDFSDLYTLINNKIISMKAPTNAEEADSLNEHIMADNFIHLKDGILKTNIKDLLDTYGEGDLIEIYDDEFTKPKQVVLNKVTAFTDEEVNDFKEGFKEYVYNPIMINSQNTPSKFEEEEKVDDKNKNENQPYRVIHGSKDNGNEINKKNVPKTAKSISKDVVLGQLMRDLKKIEERHKKAEEKKQELRRFLHAIDIKESNLEYDVRTQDVLEFIKKDKLKISQVIKKVEAEMEKQEKEIKISQREIEQIENQISLVKKETNTKSKVKVNRRTNLKTTEF